MAEHGWPREIVTRVALADDPRGNALATVSVHLPAHRALVCASLLLRDDQLTMALLSTAFEPPTTPAGSWTLTFRSLAQPSWKGNVPRSAIQSAHRRIVAEEARAARSSGVELVISDYRNYTGPDQAMAELSHE